ncbi:phage major tail tube protein [Roseospira goensis]|uniref:Phage major tail tube protein n=1 Tax=Roseospira goensis TaxID=391922 RepID=A0A7W6S2S8_9PROT|nr:phage major tail tube protein [Roseospira goensis]MBB4287843.1 hypothetical protein [Roseospira goensis]
MRHILRGYTLWAGGVDYGYETEELECALPDEHYVEHTYGGAVMTAQVPMIKIGLLEPKIKLASHNPTLAGMLLRPAGVVDTFTFRGALVDEMDGATKPSVLIYEGRLAQPDAETWAREDKAGLGYTIKGLRYFRWEIGGETLHEIGLMPAKLVVGGIDRLADINAALGR